MERRLVNKKISIPSAVPFVPFFLPIHIKVMSASAHKTLQLNHPIPNCSKNIGTGHKAIMQNQTPVIPIYPEAMKYLQAGISFIPIKADPSSPKMPCVSCLPIVGRKLDGKPKHSWKPFQDRLPTKEEVESWYGGWMATGALAGIAAITGPVSGNLEAIDIDSWDYVEPWLEQVRASAPYLIDKLVLVKTPRPGLHAYFRRMDCCDSSKKLARVNDERGAATTIIELKAIGGYVNLPPTPGGCHPTGRPYAYFGDRTLTELSIISEEERSVLIGVSRSFDQSTKPETRRPIAEPKPRLARGRPGDDFNHRKPWEEILESYGWQHSHSDGEVQFWTRPGKCEGVSATTNFGGTDRLHLFSTNVDSLEVEQSYSKFEFYAEMEHNGDHSAAARQLRKEGYGVAPKLPGGGRKRRAKSYSYKF